MFVSITKTNWQMVLAIKWGGEFICGIVRSTYVNTLCVKVHGFMNL